MSEEDTRKFVKIWNKQNGYPDGPTELPNMRYVKPGEVTWNEYDAPQIDLVQFKEFLDKLSK